MRKREWKQAPPGKGRGRPKKAPEDLSAKYRLKLEGEERVKEMRLAGMMKAEAQEAERKENTKRRKAETENEKDEVQRRKHGGQGPGGTCTAQQTTREEDKRQFKGTLQHTRGLPAAGRGREVRKVQGLII